MRLVATWKTMACTAVDRVGYRRKENEHRTADSMLQSQWRSSRSG